MVYGKGKNTKKYFYSFATKYCCNHRPDVYPIFDKFVEKAINKFIREELLPKGAKYAKLRDEYNNKYHLKIEDYKKGDLKVRNPGHGRPLNPSKKAIKRYSSPY